MIENLKIKNFILINELTLNFSSGFNVFTGETGAGKSIIIHAIDVALGAKSNKDLIKTGKESAHIELTIKYNENFPTNILEENGIEIFDNELIISKEITQTSSRSRVNGSLVTQDFIRTLREALIDIHSQHQTYVYLQPKQHIYLLDNFCGETHKKNLSEYSQIYRKYLELERKLEFAKNSLATNEQEIDFLKFQIKEIEDAEIDDIEEDTKLNEELEILSNAETLKELTYSSYQTLYGDDVNVIEALSTVKMNIAKVAGYDNELETYENEIISAIESLKETASFLRDYSENVSADYEKIDQIQERLELFNKLKRKYGNSLEAIVEQKEKFEEKLNKIDFSSEDIEILEKELATTKEALTKISNEITKVRKQVAEKLSKDVSEELHKLELPKAIFNIDVSSLDNWCENGKDKVEFMISTNVSETPKPLAKTASGGEISRVMLALKTIFAQSDNINTVIFDEIDTGISGAAAQAVADEIVELAKTHQVISITHLPIIAAKAPKHFYVKKSQTDATKINVFDLDHENKIKSLAMMASGEITEESINFAKGLMKEGELIK